MTIGGQTGWRYGGALAAAGRPPVDPLFAYRALAARFVLDPSRAGLFTVGASITAVLDALGSGRSLTGTGLQRDTVHAIDGKASVNLANASGTAALAITTDGPASGAAHTIHLVVSIQSVQSDVGTLALIGRQGGAAGASALLIRSSGPTLCGGSFSVGARVNNAVVVTADVVHIIDLVYTGTVLSIWLDGILLGTEAVALTWAQGYGLTAANTGSPPPNCRVYLKSVLSSALTKTQHATLGNADRRRFPSIAVPSILRTCGDSITAGEGVTPSTQAWPAVALAAINSGRYEPAVLQNVGISGSVEPADATTAIDAYQPKARSTVDTIGWGSNDINGGATAASVIAKDAIHAAGLRAVGATVAFATVLPRSSYDAGKEAERLALNTSRRASGAVVLDFASIPEAANPANLTYYQDGTHPTVALHAIMGAYAATVLAASLA